ncbi:uncharacterized protein LOC127078587 [Lathyrus oleraceus]|uniref:uncharacterized protein LOC127078587 n=1 Tax=Pisum sativum TaxID=3888 RepID=UPI0021D2B5A1|nr:uncharacterized protein LOC127078587 [Pisum sativum]
MLRAQTNKFRQKDKESLFDVWERYKDMMRPCPYHGLEQWLIIHTFYNGLLYNTKMKLNAAVGGALMDKPYEDAYQLIENMAQNYFQWGGERTTTEKPTTKIGTYEVNGIDHINAKVDALTQKIENLTITLAAVVAAVAPNCELCGTPGHTNIECKLLLAGIPTDQVNYAQGNPYSNTYNPGWRNHPNFSYKNNNALFAPNPTPIVPPGYQKGALAAPQAPRNSNLELMMENLMNAKVQQNKDFANQNAHTTTAAPTGAFPGQPQPNPKGHANTITLRIGTELDEPVNPRLQNPSMYQNSGKATEMVTTDDQPEEQNDKREEDKNSRP